MGYELNESFPPKVLLGRVFYHSTRKETGKPGDHPAPPSQRSKFSYQSQVFKDAADSGQSRPKCSHPNNTLNKSICSELLQHGSQFQTQHSLIQICSWGSDLLSQRKIEHRTVKSITRSIPTPPHHGRAKTKRGRFSLSKQTLHSNNSTSALANPVMEENPGEENCMTQNKYFLSGFGATRSKRFPSHPASAVTLDRTEKLSMRCLQVRLWLSSKPRSKRLEQMPTPEQQISQALEQVDSVSSRHRKGLVEGNMGKRKWSTDVHQPTLLSSPVF